MPPLYTIRHLLPDAGDMPNYAPASPKTFPFLRLPAEIRLRIFQLFTGTKQKEESYTDLAIRAYTRQNLLLCNKANYQDLAPVLFRAVTMVTRNPWDIINQSLLHPNQEWVQNIKRVDLRLGYLPREGFGEYWSSAAGHVQPANLEIWTKMLHQKFPVLKQIRILFIVSSGIRRNRFNSVVSSSSDEWLE